MKEEMAKADGEYFIDISKWDTVAGSNDGTHVSIYDPEVNADTGIFIEVLGKDSDEFQRVSREQSKKRMSKMSKGGFRNTAPIPVEEIERDGIELLAACTKSWEHRPMKADKSGWGNPHKGMIYIKGEKFPFSRESVLSVYIRFPWIKEQVDTAIGDRANFIKS
jgi:hypothetical protein